MGDIRNRLAGIKRAAAAVLRLVPALVAVGLAVSPVAAQDWPSRNVRIVVPFGAGSTPDLIMRVIADHLQQKLKQTFVVENKAGASGMLGTDAVAKAEPDGHTIGISIGGPLAINPLLFAKMPYDPAKDIAPITTLVSLPSALAVNAVSASTPSRTSSRSSGNPPANSISARSAPARCRISPWRRLQSKAERRSCTFPMPARRRR